MKLVFASARYYWSNLALLERGCLSGPVLAVSKPIQKNKNPTAVTRLSAFLFIRSAKANHSYNCKRRMHYDCYFKTKRT